MKHMFLGNLLSCMVICQTFGCNNEKDPYVYYPGDRSSPNGIHNHGYTCEELLRFSQCRCGGIDNTLLRFKAYMACAAKTPEVAEALLYEEVMESRIGDSSAELVGFEKKHLLLAEMLQKEFPFSPTFLLSIARNLANEINTIITKVILINQAAILIYPSAPSSDDLALAQAEIRKSAENDSDCALLSSYLGDRTKHTYDSSEQRDRLYELCQLKNAMMKKALRA